MVLIEAEPQITESPEQSVTDRAGAALLTCIARYALAPPAGRDPRRRLAGARVALLRLDARADRRPHRRARGARLPFRLRHSRRLPLRDSRARCAHLRRKQVIPWPPPISRSSAAKT